MSAYTSSSEDGYTDTDSQQSEEYLEGESSAKTISDLSLKDGAETRSISGQKNGEILSSETEETEETESEGLGSEAEMETKPSEYHGVLVKPLSSFGAFKMSPESCEPRWIRDHTSGEVHEDMPTIAFLYSQNLTLPAAAKEFVSQSPKVEEEADWERRKAVFYSFYPQEVQERAFQALSELTALEASRFIAKKISWHEQEILLRPFPRYEINSLLAWLTKKLAALCEETFKMISTKGEIMAKKEACLEEQHPSYLKDCFYSNWREDISQLQLVTQKVINAKLFWFQLDSAQARADPRTHWIHLRTSLMDKNLVTDSGFTNEVSRLPIPEELKFGESPQSIVTATKNQLKKFEASLRLVEKPFSNYFDLYHNDDEFKAFEFRLSYRDYSPRECFDHISRHLDAFEKAPVKVFTSTPVIQGWPKSHHEILVYLELKQKDLPKEHVKESDSTLKLLNEHAFCSSCFSVDHLTMSCEVEVSQASSSG